MSDSHKDKQPTDHPIQNGGDKRVPVKRHDQFDRAEDQWEGNVEQ